MDEGADPAAAADMAKLFAGREEEIERPEDAQWPLWAGYIHAAWNELRDDRFCGAMGGMGRIYFTAIENYAERYDIAGSAFDDFLMFVRVLDDEYMRHADEKQKTESKNTKT